jgi:hypothetical protein
MGGGAPEDFNPDQNPFEGILASLQGGQEAPMGQAPQQPSAPTPQPQGGQNVPGAAPQLPKDQTQEGVVTGNTKHLLSAVSALQQYITASHDRDEILIGRNMIRLLTQLIEKDQATEQDSL